MVKKYFLWLVIFFFLGKKSEKNLIGSLIWYEKIGDFIFKATSPSPSRVLKVHTLVSVSVLRSWCGTKRWGKSTGRQRNVSSSTVREAPTSAETSLETRRIIYGSYNTAECVREADQNLILQTTHKIHSTGSFLGYCHFSVAFSHVAREEWSVKATIWAECKNCGQWIFISRLFTHFHAVSRIFNIPVVLVFFFFF